MLGVFPEEIPARETGFPIAAIAIRNTAGQILSHRDYLGAILSLQIERECIGDIIIEDAAATVFLIRSMLPFVQENLTKIGRDVYKRQL